MPPWRASSSFNNLTLFEIDPPPVGRAAVTAGPTVRLRMLVAYDGSGFHGFALQPGQRTVAGALCSALERYLRHTVELTCAGRTDAGVHAWGQVVSLDARADVDVMGLQRAVNRATRPAIVVREVSVAPPAFDARRSANGRRYRYTLLHRPVDDPFLAPTTWHVPAPLNLRSMQLACDPLYGEHDFSSFCRRPPKGSLVRMVRDVRWIDLGNGLLRFEIEASSFCHQMVRSVVGTLVDVGTGRLRAGDMTGILGAEDRSAAGQLAPPHGLCLW
ncbi:MAG: tRNA pseudouridine(38-40) synthase TruA, partial [Actinomycetota bacterium]|nr:tRNA pseudouridine(38-40) synthase TruA [Actinomycetota bacterium]